MSISLALSRRAAESGSGFNCVLAAARRGFSAMVAVLLQASRSAPTPQPPLPAPLEPVTDGQGSVQRPPRRPLPVRGRPRLSATMRSMNPMLPRPSRGRLPTTPFGRPPQH